MRLLLFFAIINLYNMLPGYSQLLEKGETQLKIFSNFHNQLNHEVPESGFEIRRAYLGYKTPLENHFSTEIKIDIGSPDDESDYSRLKRYAYFKIANLVYQKNSLRWTFGLTGTYIFDLQESFWGYRYIRKSFMDEYDFGSSADLGTTIEYQFSDWLTVDYSLMNGEGYTSLQSDEVFKNGMGITLTFFDELISRFYADLMAKENNETTLAGFIGYRYKDKARLGIEYNHKFNFLNTKNHELYGYSIYGTYIINDKIELFGRYDQLYSNIISNNPMPWNIASDESAITSGIQYQLIPQIKVSLNYQDAYPYAADQENQSFIYINFEYKI